jgi:hypothetical protein
MKRRRFVQAVVAAPAAPVVLAQQTPAPARPGLPSATPAAAAPRAEEARLDTAVADEAADMIPRLFNAQQLAALRKLCEIIMPAIDGAPSGVEAGAPEFLDFLMGESPADRRQVYQAGLDALNSQAKKRFRKSSFAEVTASEADAILSPLREPWTYEPPADPLARFLRAAKADIRTATVNSREYASRVASAGGGRRGGGGGSGLYWYPID